MQTANRLLVVAVDAAGRDDEEVAVARGVAAAEREGAGEIDADQVCPDNRLDPAAEVAQEIVQFGKRCRSQWTTITFRMTMLSPRTRFSPTTTAVPVLLRRSSRA